MTHDGGGGLAGRPVYTNLHVKTARAQHGGIDHVHAIGCANHHHIIERFHAVEFGKELWHDGGFHVGGYTGAAGS